VTQPALEPGEPTEPPGHDEASEVFDPDDHPHPLRAEDVTALLPKEIG
jgi:hypothetical protein